VTPDIISLCRVMPGTPNYASTTLVLADALEETSDGEAAAWVRDLPRILHPLNVSRATLTTVGHCEPTALEIFNAYGGWRWCDCIALAGHLHRRPGQACGPDRELSPDRTNGEVMRGTSLELEWLVARMTAERQRGEEGLARAWLVRRMAAYLGLDGEPYELANQYGHVMAVRLDR
jgi:hypothetical protein